MKLDQVVNLLFGQQTHFSGQFSKWPIAVALFGVHLVGVRLGNKLALYGQFSDASVFGAHQIQSGSHLFHVHFIALDQILSEELDAHFGSRLGPNPFAFLGEQGS